METNPQVPGACGVALLDGDHVVLISRADGKGIGFPFGKKEAGETDPAAAARELREEAGYVVDPADLVELYRRRVGRFHCVFYTLRPGATFDRVDRSHAHEGDVLHVRDPKTHLTAPGNVFAAVNHQALVAWAGYRRAVGLPVPFEV